MSMLKWFRRKPAKRYFAASFCAYTSDGMEYGMMRVVVDGESMPAAAALRESLRAAKGCDRVAILAAMEMANEADLDAYLSGAEMSEECHVRTMQ